MAIQQGFGAVKVTSKLKAQIKYANIKLMEATKEHFAQNFDKQQFEGKKWDEVKRRTPGNKYYENQIVGGVNKPSGKKFVTEQGADWQTRNILVGTSGSLHNAVHNPMTRVFNGGYGFILAVNGVKYAQYHNDGTPYMPQRIFWSHDSELTKIHLDLLLYYTERAWQKS